MVDAGQAVTEYQDKVLRNLHGKRIQVDEIWAFCYAKQKNIAAIKSTAIVTLLLKYKEEPHVITVGTKFTCAMIVCTILDVK